jgi:uncharacterized integral membrane protein
MQRTKLNFLWMHWHTPLGVGLLLAAVLGGLTVLFLGGVRMLQIRKAATQHRKADAPAS